MAHIVSCMADADVDAPNPVPVYKPSSPQPPNDSAVSTPTFSSAPFSWRMNQDSSSPSRKYQLFPKAGQQSAGRGLDPEKAFALAMGQPSGAATPQTAGNNGSEKAEKPSLGLKLRLKEHGLIRRRKVSVPELGPMTTVQEVSMDSPTIPGRPPLHERSISAPGTSWKPTHLAECMTEDIPEVASPPADGERSTSSTPRQPLSPRQLAPLVIPPQASTIPRLIHQSSMPRLRSGSSAAEGKHTMDFARTARSPCTPLTASTALTTPRSAVSNAHTNSTLPTPVTAPISGESRASPKPWEPNNAGRTTPVQDGGLTTPKSEAGGPRSAPMAAMGHRRGQSECSIMERGRPRKRPDSKLVGGTLKRTNSKRSQSAERKAFEELPRGWKAADATSKLDQTQVDALQRQAVGQVARFDVLRPEDVEALSKELRQLDERAEYLRRTYNSLRAGRRNLRSRVCQYLLSPRVAKFSHESMLKQEEALAELDASIDDWASKLDHAENRRTRVRQKLLEHVAAAATLPASATAASESLQMAMGIRSPPLGFGTGNLSTPPRSPPRSPLKHSFTSGNGSQSPQRGVSAQVPSTILEQPLFEEAAMIPSIVDDDKASIRRADVESIRIYADHDVYTLLADVESQITKMSIGVMDNTPLPDDECERRALHRARSHELLSGLGKNTPKSPPPPSPPLKNSPTDSEAVFLTKAVFKPERAVAAAY